MTPFTGGFSGFILPPLLRLLPAGVTVVEWDFHSLKIGASHGALRNAGQFPTPSKEASTPTVHGVAGRRIPDDDLSFEAAFHQGFPGIDHSPLGRCLPAVCVVLDPERCCGAGEFSAELPGKA